jgi:hypothetical protein
MSRRPSLRTVAFAGTFLAIGAVVTLFACTDVGVTGDGQGVG